jgi:hypothetical protein
VIVPQPTSPPSSDGAIYSPDVEIPKPRPTNWEALATYYHDLALRLQRSQEGAEKDMARPESPWEPW